MNHEPTTMKKIILPYLVAALSLLTQPVFAQQDTTSLGLAGDNLDLYAVLDLFQKSKTIEGFEKSLNEQKSGINNLDLDLDKKVDFIKVVTKQKESSFTFILQVAVSEKETQDVAVILVDKKDGKVTMQIIGDEELYGKNYIVEPKPKATANPGYTGADPVVVNVDAPVTTVVVEQAPIVQYVYSPAYVPYYPPYHYGYYPPYFAAFTVMAVGIYRSNNYYHHGYGHGYHNTTVIHNENNFNNYHGGDRNTSNRVNHNNRSGNYGDGRGASNRASNRASGGASAGTRPSTQPSTRPSGGASASTRPSTTPSNRQTPSASTRPSNSNYSSGGGRTRSGGGYSGGGGGGARGGGGGGGRRR
jgi:hypothetical protein